MKRFMLLTCGFAKPTPEMMSAWGTWQESVADRVVEHGGFNGGREVSRPGTKDLPLAGDSLTGFCILKAEALAEAEALAGRTPFVTSIRVYEIT